MSYRPKLRHGDIITGRDEIEVAYPSYHSTLAAGWEGQRDRPTVFTLWDSGLLKTRVLEEFGIKSKIITQKEFTDWLVQKVVSPRGLLNLHLVVLLKDFNKEL